MAATVAAGADWVGFVFAAASPRAITPDAAAALAAPYAIPRVGLFVDPSDAEVDAVLAGVRLDILQLHTSLLRARPFGSASACRSGTRPPWRSRPTCPASRLASTRFCWMRRPSPVPPYPAATPGRSTGLSCTAGPRHAPGYWPGALHLKTLAALLKRLRPVPSMSHPVWKAAVA